MQPSLTIRHRFSMLLWLSFYLSSFSFSSLPSAVQVSCRGLTHSRQCFFWAWCLYGQIIGVSRKHLPGLLVLFSDWLAVIALIFFYIDAPAKNTRLADLKAFGFSFVCFCFSSFFVSDDIDHLDSRFKKKCNLKKKKDFQHAEVNTCKPLFLGFHHTVPSHLHVWIPSVFLVISTGDSRMCAGSRHSFYFAQLPRVISVVSFRCRCTDELI